MGRLTISGRNGYTLIELMIVLTIIGILVSMAQPNLQRTVIRARENSLRQSLFVMRDVIDQFYADRGKYPDSLDDLVSDRYVRSIPQDPFTKSASTWVVIPPEGDVKGVVFDVHSGSNLVSLEGTPYNEW
ncbi:MAG: type II secretion system protein [Desulfobacteraceae bacterium]|nr:MAG: type II secretion system protein [Desulfobacteraceae bacterium]